MLAILLAAAAAYAPLSDADLAKALDSVSGARNLPRGTELYFEASRLGPGRGRSLACSLARDADEGVFEIKKVRLKGSDFYMDYDNPSSSRLYRVLPEQSKVLDERELHYQEEAARWHSLCSDPA